MTELGFTINSTINTSISKCSARCLARVPQTVNPPFLRPPFLRVLLLLSSHDSRNSAFLESMHDLRYNLTARKLFSAHWTG